MSKKTYEHKAVEGGSAAEVIEQVAQLGRVGWEMVSAVYDTDARKHVAYMKRKIRHGKSHDTSDE